MDGLGKVLYNQGHLLNSELVNNFVVIIPLNDDPNSQHYSPSVRLACLRQAEDIDLRYSPLVCRKSIMSLLHSTPDSPIWWIRTLSILRAIQLGAVAPYGMP